MARRFEVLLVGWAQGRRGSLGEFGRAKALAGFLGHRMRRLERLAWLLVLKFPRSCLNDTGISKNGDGDLTPSETNTRQHVPC